MNERVEGRPALVSRSAARSRLRRGSTGAALIATMIGCLAACAAAPPSSANDPASTGSSAPSLPPVGGTFDYQLGGAYPPDADVEIVVRDRTDSPDPARYSICYVNGFQTQPGDAARWRSDPSDLLLSVDGEAVVDPAWPDELLLDTSTPERRSGIARIVGAMIDDCARAGYDAVEIDNLDSFTRSHGRLDLADNLALAGEFADRAHANGLAIAQKNTAESAGVLREQAGFDFAIAESCHAWDECGAYREVYGEHVLGIEYPDELRGSFPQACADRDSPDSLVLRDRALRPAGEPGHVAEFC
ncbi:endo alpha-1,4 polygalactosaminidase [Agromyces sp. NPDC058126]|uniref:endo alpha-1,4 polygalactosaminidase n=1 Tax=Agromyces sp. NPDC058126 TaxID=3346350 RepID=UPI0036DEF9CC